MIKEIGNFVLSTEHAGKLMIGFERYPNDDPRNGFCIYFHLFPQKSHCRWGKRPHNWIPFEEFGLGPLLLVCWG